MAALCQIAYFAAMRSLYQCIFVTFSLSVCLIYALDNAVRRRTPVSVLSAAAAVAAVVFVTEGLPRILIHTDFGVDYGLWGVMLRFWCILAGENGENWRCSSSVSVCWVCITAGRSGGGF